MNTVTIYWMIFRPKGHDVLYIWNGQWPAAFYIPEHEQPASNWYWSGILPPARLDQSEIDLLNAAFMTKRKTLFTLPRKGKQRYQILARGVYNNENL